MTRKAFTLMEVNLAILIMAGGILAVLGLYSLGFRENRQSAEDVASSAYADAVLSPLVTALSSTNIQWSTFRDLQSAPGNDGWKRYFNSDGVVVANPESLARSVYSSVMGKLGASGVDAAWPQSASGGLKAGLVVLHDRGSAVVRLGFRATKQSGMLLAAPMYYTEVRFQGAVDEGGAGQ